MLLTALFTSTANSTSTIAFLFSASSGLGSSTVRALLEFHASRGRSRWISTDGPYRASMWQECPMPFVRSCNPTTGIQFHYLMGAPGTAPAKMRRRDVPVEAEFPFWLHSMMSPFEVGIKRLDAHRMCLFHVERAEISINQDATPDKAGSGDMRFVGEVWGPLITMAQQSQPPPWAEHANAGVFLLMIDDLSKRTKWKTDCLRYGRYGRSNPRYQALCSPAARLGETVC